MNSDTLHYECCLAVKTKGYKKIIEEVECKLFGLKFFTMYSLRF